MSDIRKGQKMSTLKMPQRIDVVCTHCWSGSLIEWSKSGALETCPNCDAPANYLVREA